MPVTRFVAPGPEVAMQTPASPGGARIAFRGEGTALFVTGQHDADLLRLCQSLVNRHRGAARIRENHVHSLPLEATHQNLRRHSLPRPAQGRRISRAEEIFFDFIVRKGGTFQISPNIRR